MVLYQEATALTLTLTATMTENRVAKRKTHTKSRKGCFQCKQRHTKVRVKLDTCPCPARPISVSCSKLCQSPDMMPDANPRVCL